MDEHQGGWSAAAEFVPQTGAVDFDPVHDERSLSSLAERIPDRHFREGSANVRFDGSALVASFPLREEGDDRGARDGIDGPDPNRSHHCWRHGPSRGTYEGQSFRKNSNVGAGGWHGDL